MAEKANVSDFNLERLKPKELESHLGLTIAFGGNITVIGRRGGGKSTIAKSAIKKSDHEEIYLNLSVMERPDMGGYPNFNASKEGQKYVDMMLPKFYEKLIDGNRPCVALLDEVDKAESALWAPLLEFTQFHTINGRSLPNLKAVIMTGNLPSEGGARPILPLLDRSEKFLLESDHNEWLDWSGKEGKIHPSVTAFIADHPDDLYGDVDPGDIYADPSPRGWEAVSKIVSYGEKHNSSNHLITQKVAGCVGKKSGIKYTAYFNHYQVLLPLVERIMNGEKIKEFDNIEPSKRMVVTMIACARVARVLDDLKKDKEYSGKAFPSSVVYVGRFLREVDPEIALVALRSQITLERVADHQLDSDKNWDAVLEDIASNMKG